MGSNMVVGHSDTFVVQPPDILRGLVGVLL
jgi:hypothetical protein